MVLKEAMERLCLQLQINSQQRYTQLDIYDLGNPFLGRFSTQTISSQTLPVGEPLRKNLAKMLIMCDVHLKYVSCTQVSALTPTLCH